MRSFQEVSSPTEFPTDIPEPLLTTAELMLLGVGILLTICVAAFLLYFFISHQRREARLRRSR